MTRTDIIEDENMKIVDENSREQSFEQSLVNKRGNKLNNKNTNSYMAQPEVKEFNRAIRNKMLNNTHYGRPYAFESIEKLEEEVGKFFDICERTNTIPTVVNLAVWLGCHKDTIYAHANNPNSPFSDFFKTLLTYFHGSLESGAIGGGVNPVLYMFLGKNYFGMQDVKSLSIAPTSNQEQLSSPETMNALQKQLEEETVTNATFTEM